MRNNPLLRLLSLLIPIMVISQVSVAAPLSKERPSDFTIHLIHSPDGSNQINEIFMSESTSFLIKRKVYDHGTIHEVKNHFRVTPADLDYLYSVIRKNKFDQISVKKRLYDAATTGHDVVVNLDNRRIEKSTRGDQTVGGFYMERFNHVVSAVIQMKNRRTRGRVQRVSLL